MSSIIIKPKSGSKKFYKNARQFQRVIDPATNQPTGEYAAAGEYSGERFPNSMQKPRINYSFQKRRWMVLKDNGEAYTKEEVNELVKGCHLTYYKQKDPRKGQYITEADVTNFSDPFFNHPELTMRLKEGSATLNPKDSSFDKLIAAGLRGNRQFKEQGKAGSRIGAANVKYVITDKESDAKQHADKRNKTIDIVKRFDALTDKQRRIIARIMGLGVRENTDQELVNDVLFQAAMDDATTVQHRNISKQSMFFSLANLDSERLELKDKIARAMQKHLIRKTKEGWNFRGQKIGRTIESVETFFDDGENQEALLALHQAIEDMEIDADI